MTNKISNDRLQELMEDLQTKFMKPRLGEKKEYALELHNILCDYQDLRKEKAELNDMVVNLCREKGWLMQDAERLAEAYKNAVEDVENFAVKHGITYLRVAGAMKLLIEHEDLMQKMKVK